MGGPRPDGAAGPSAFAAALRTAIERRGLTLDRLRQRLDARGHRVSVATLSYWQSGRSHPERASSLAALAVLEEILAVPAGRLLRLARSGRRGGGAPPAQLDSFAPHTTDGAVMDEMVASLGLSWQDGLRRTSVHEHVRVRPDRTEASHDWRETLLALRSGVDRYPMCFQYDDPAGDVTCAGVQHVEVGRVVENRQRRLLLVELVLPRALEVGESMTIDYVVAHANNTVPLEYVEAGTVGWLQDYHLWVTFEPPAVPWWAHTYRVVKGEKTITPLPVTGPTLELHLRDVAPGVVGVRWGWSAAAGEGAEDPAGDALASEEFR